MNTYTILTNIVTANELTIAPNLTTTDEVRAIDTYFTTKAGWPHKTVSLQKDGYVVSSQELLEMASKSIASKQRALFQAAMDSGELSN